jgi:presenilin-like A22 family membrane protease
MFPLNTWRNVYLALIFIFALTQFLGILFQYTIFEIESQGDPGFSKEKSQTLSEYRDTGRPILILPILLVVVLNLYLFLFRFNAIVKFLKTSIYIAAIFSFAMIVQILSGMFLSILSVVIRIPFSVASLQYLILFISVLLPVVLLIKDKHKNVVKNALGISLCAIAGSALATYFNIVTILAVLLLLSVYDYLFVKKTRQIVRLAEMFDEHDIPFALDLGQGQEVVMEEVERADNDTDYAVRQQLGFGDLVFATGLAVATFIDNNFTSSLIMIGTVTFSLAIFLYYLHRTGNTEPQPAIPPIFLGGLFGALLLWSLA